MLKRVDVADVRLGMHLHRLEGTWMSHPFWRTSFTLTDPEDLARLRGSGVEACWIDTARGRDLDAVPAPALPRPATAGPSAAAAAVAGAASPTAPAPRPPPAPTHDMAAELDRAAAICSRGRAAVVAMFGEARLGKALDAEGCLPLVDDVASSVLRNPGALVSLARLKTADDYSYMHSVAVCALMVALGRQLGMDDDACRAAGLAGLLHDLGKASMPLEVLNKPGRLTEDEYAVIRTHPLRGHEMLTEARGATPWALDVCLHHHERPDGQGYPHRLGGDDLTQLARMGAVCDVYDAITSNRPYKAGWDPAESIAKMTSWAGQFDETILHAFVRSLGIYPIGSLVRLASGKLAVVVEQHPEAPVAPVVKVFFSTQSNMPVTPKRLDLAAPGCPDRIVGRESAAAWGFKHLNEIWLDPQTLKKSRG